MDDVVYDLENEIDDMTDEYIFVHKSLIKAELVCIKGEEDIALKFARQMCENEYVEFTEDTYISYNDADNGDLLKFVGRWQENDSKTANVGYWTRPYLEIRTISDNLKIHFGVEETGEDNGVYLYINNKFISAFFFRCLCK